jgi:hypothetical protein
VFIFILGPFYISGVPLLYLVDFISTVEALHGGFSSFAWSLLYILGRAFSVGSPFWLGVVTCTVGV